jgi:ATP-binding cassette subfamily F protein uup
MKNPNFLILDEPTNDLDIDTLNVLEEFLTNYGGVLMLVSHDRYLLDKLTDQLFIMEEAGHVRIYNGNYSSYRVELEDNKQQNKRATVIEPVQTNRAKKNKLSFKEQKELETAEKEIEQLEKQIADIKGQLNSSGIENNKVIELSQKILDLNKQLDGKTIRWLELTELNEA